MHSDAADWPVRAAHSPRDGLALSQALRARPPNARTLPALRSRHRWARPLRRWRRWANAALMPAPHRAARPAHRSEPAACTLLTAHTAIGPRAGACESQCRERDAGSAMWGAAAELPPSRRRASTEPPPRRRRTATRGPTRRPEPCEVGRVCGYFFQILYTSTRVHTIRGSILGAGAHSSAGQSIGRAAMRGAMRGAMADAGSDAGSGRQWIGRGQGGGGGRPRRRRWWRRRRRRQRRGRRRPRQRRGRRR